MSAITSHVLDTSLGEPVAGLGVRLALLEGGAFQELADGMTDSDGRVNRLLGAEPLAEGVYRLTFETGAHYRTLGRDSFYERVEIQFRVIDATEHYHVPLLLSPFGYSTYRGS
jgi:5-hydroxyisourate hydrolase